jgi:hypothetical protein
MGEAIGLAKVSQTMRASPGAGYGPGAGYARSLVWMTRRRRDAYGTAKLLRSPSAGSAQRFR